MHNVTVKTQMTHAVEDVWHVLDDFGAIYAFNPAVESSNIIGTKTTGKGARRICNFYDGSSLKETITQYSPNKGFSLELSDFALPLKTATAHFRLVPMPNGQSVLSITMAFQPKFGPLGWLMAKLIMRPLLTKALRGLSKGLDDYMRTGRQVGKDGVLLAA